MKPFFSDRGAGTSKTTLVEDDKVISEDFDVANTLNSFFENAVPSLVLHIPEEHMETTGVADPVEAISLKYSRHPSIQRKKLMSANPLFVSTMCNCLILKKNLGNLIARKGANQTVYLQNFLKNIMQSVVSHYLIYLKLV